MYRDWAAGYRIDAICTKYGVSRTTFHSRIRRASAWIRSELLDDIQDLRAQQTMLLMGHYRELKRLWDHNRYEPEIVEQPAAPQNLPEVPSDKPTIEPKAERVVAARRGRKLKKISEADTPHDVKRVVERIADFKKRRPVTVDNPLQIMSQITSVLGAVSEINGLKRLKIEHSEAEPEERYAGMSRADAVLRQIERLKVIYERDAAVSIPGSSIEGEIGPDDSPPVV